MHTIERISKHPLTSWIQLKNRYLLQDRIKPKHKILNRKIPFSETPPMHYGTHHNINRETLQYFGIGATHHRIVFPLFVFDGNTQRWVVKASLCYLWHKNKHTSHLIKLPNTQGPVVSILKPKKIKLTGLKNMWVFTNPIQALQSYQSQKQPGIYLSLYAGLDDDMQQLILGMSYRYKLKTVTLMCGPLQACNALQDQACSLHINTQFESGTI